MTLSLKLIPKPETPELDNKFNYYLLTKNNNYLNQIIYTKIKMVNRVKKMKRWTGAIADMGEKAITLGKMAGFKNGGKVKKNMVAKLHKNEVVLSAKQVKSLKNLLK